MLTILKIIGIVLLAILALVLLILLIVLLVPLRLDLKARYDEEVRARVNISWLLKAALVRLEWLKDHGLLRVKLLGLKTLMKKHLGDWGPQPEAKTEPAEETSVPDTETKTETEEKNPEKDSDAEKPGTENAEKPDTEQAKTPDGTEVKAESAEKTENKEEAPEEKAAEEKVQQKLDGEERLELLVEKLDGIEGKWDEIQSLLYDEKNRKTLRRIGKQLKRIGHHLAPTKFVLEGELGFDDPYTTGKIMGLLYSLYGIFGEHIRIQGNYEEPAMKFYLVLKGRIRLGLFVSVGLNLLLDGNLRRWIKKLMHKDGKTKADTAGQADQEKEAA